jgi:hypothetical protein
MQQKNAQENVSSSNPKEELHYLTIEEKLKELWAKEEEFLKSVGVEITSK